MNKKANFKFSSILLLILILGLLNIVFLQASKKEKNVTIEGVAAIIGNRAIERDRAIQDALRKSVEQAVGIQITSESLTQNYKLIYNNIISKTHGYIIQYDILSERIDGDAFRIEIAAKVGIGKIEKDLQAIGLLLERKNLPRIMILIIEKSISQNGRNTYSLGLSQSETTLIKKFAERGFYCVDTTTVKKSINRDRILRALDGDVKAARVIGKEFGAEVLITGKAFANSKGKVRNSNINSSSSNITVRAVQVDTGKIIAIESAKSVAAHLDEYTAGSIAIEKASFLVADRILKQILNQWTSDTSSSTNVQVHIAGVRNYNDLQNFKIILKNKIRGIQNIFQRDFSGNSARLEIRINGSTQTFSDDIQKTPFIYFKALVTAVSQNKVMIKLIHN